MKTLGIYILLMAVLLGSSCKKELQVSSLDNFEVSLSKNKYNVGEPVELNFGGEADYIYFYSGEVGYNYDSRGGRTISIDKVKLSFNSAKAIGAQANQLSVLVSNDFNGDYSSLNVIKNATWTDVSSRFTLATNATATPSGVADLSDFKVAGKPIYIAYKYLTKPQNINGLGTTWTITGFSLLAETSIGNQNIADMFNSGFRIIDPYKDTTPAQSSITTTRFTFLSNLYDATIDPETEHWGVSKAIDTETLNLGKDKATAIKSMATSGIKQYKYTYAKAGNYTIYVVAKNQNIYEQKEVVKKLEITIYN
ncbi:DUF5017 domain-containing protein [Pedobacter sp.]